MIALHFEWSSTKNELRIPSHGHDLYIKFSLAFWPFCLYYLGNGSKPNANRCGILSLLSVGGDVVPCTWMSVPAKTGQLFKDWWWLLSPRARHRICPPKFKIVETYWHDHSLEKSWGALSDGTIGFLIQPFVGKKFIFRIFLKKPSVLKELKMRTPTFKKAEDGITEPEVKIWIMAITSSLSPNSRP
jgi:hypothetical protein